MTAKTPEPEASSSSSVPDQSKPTAKPVTNADSTTQAAAAPGASAAGSTPAAPAPATPAPTTSSTGSTSTGSTSAGSASTGSTATGSTAAIKALPAGKAQAAPPAKVTPPARKAPPPGPRRGGSGAAAVAAVASLLVAVGAIAIAVYALDVAREAKSQAAIAASDARAVAPAATPPAPTPTAAATTPAPPPPTYTAELSGAVLRIPPAESLCASVYVDVDTLQTGTYAGHDFYVSRCQGQHVIRIDRKDGAVPTAPSPTPEMCAAQLDGAASAPEIILDVRAGLTFCMLTSKADAAQQGIQQHLAIVEVRAVGSDQSLATVISTYRIPV